MSAIDYYYDVPLPNDFSATIQILKTGRAFAEAGRPFALLARLSVMTPADLLRRVGLDRHELLSIGRAFPRWPRAPGARRAMAALGVLPGLDPRADRVMMSRGESGFLVASALRRPDRSGPRRLFVHELHFLAHVRLAERLLGRSLAPGEPLPPAAERLRRTEARVLARADGLIFLTQELRDAARAAFGGDTPAVVAPSGVDAPSPRSRMAEADVDLIYVGKIEPRKGVALALEVMRHLPDRRLRVVGNGPGTAWARALARDLGVEARVDFAGRVDHARVAEELARARVGLVPLPRGVDQVSERFTSPLKLLEMMAAGLPVVATDLPSVRAVCRDGAEALIAPPESPERLAHAVERLLRDPDLARRLGAAGARRAEDFSWSRRARLIGKLLDGIPR